jgi:hypothetical protein
MTTAAEIRGRVLYDDSCGSCRRRVPFGAELSRSEGLRSSPCRASGSKLVWAPSRRVCCKISGFYSSTAARSEERMCTGT